jgi:microcystin-dependent protein
MAIPTASSRASSMGNLTISLPGCVNIQTGDTSQQEWDGTGGIALYAGSDVPTGWLLCNGAEISREDYKRLFDVISTTYGVGNGNTTFNLPDLRGRFPLGLDNMGGTSADVVTATEADTLGESGGADEVALTTAQMPQHRHQMRVLSDSQQLNAFSSTLNDVNPNPSKGTALWFTVGENSDRARIMLDESKSALLQVGSGNAHNNMPPYLSLNYIIKT